MSKITTTNNGEPETPATGRTVQWADTVTKTLRSKDDDGLVTAYGDTKKVLVSSTDTTEGFLLDKLDAGGGVTLTKTNPAGDEKITISISGPMVFVGPYDAATNTPDLDVSPSGIFQGYTYKVTVAGDFFTEPVQVGDVLIASIDDPIALTDWAIVEANDNTTVSGPASSVDNAIARFDGVTGKVIQDYSSLAPTISDDGAITMLNDLTAADTFKFFTATKSAQVGYDITQGTRCFFVNSGAGHGEIITATHAGAARFNITTLGNMSVLPAAINNGILLYSHLTTSKWVKFSSDATGNVLYNHNSHDHIFQANGVESLRIGFDKSAEFKGQIKVAVGTTLLAPINFQNATALKSSPVDGDVEYKDGHLYLTAHGSRHALNSSTGIKTSTTTVTNTIAETTFYSYVVSANELHLDERIIITCDGVFSNASASDDFIIRFKFGGITFHSITRTGGNVTNEGWEAVYKGTIRVAGASGTFVDHARYLDGSGIYASADIAEHSIDTTAGGTVELTIQWVNAKIGNTFSCTQGDLTFKH